MITTPEKPFSVVKRCKNASELANLGPEVVRLITLAGNDGQIGLEPSHGRLYLRIDVEIITNPVEALTQQESYQFDAQGAD